VVPAGCRGGGCSGRGLLNEERGWRWAAHSLLGLHSSVPRCLHLLRLAAWPLRTGIPALGSRLRLEEGLVFPGFDVLIPQRSCSLCLRSAAASELRFPQLPLCCHVRLRPWSDNETCRRLTSPSWLRGALTVLLGAAGARGAGAAALGLGCPPRSLTSLNA